MYQYITFVYIKETFNSLQCNSVIVWLSTACSVSQDRVQRSPLASRGCTTTWASPSPWPEVRVVSARYLPLGSPLVWATVTSAVWAQCAATSRLVTKNLQDSVFWPLTFVSLLPCSINTIKLALLYPSTLAHHVLCCILPTEYVEVISLFLSLLCGISVTWGTRLFLFLVSWLNVFIMDLLIFIRIAYLIWWFNLS